MKQPTVIEGIGIAVAFTGLWTLLYIFLIVPFGFRFALPACIATLTYLYVNYLLMRRESKLGAMTLRGLSLLSLVSGVLLGFGPSMMVGLSLGVVWVVRSTRYHCSLMGSLVDAALCVGGFCIAVWSYALTASIILAFWVWFLAQSLFVLIPARKATNTSFVGDATNGQTSFEQAYRDAQSSIRQIVTGG